MLGKSIMLYPSLSKLTLSLSFSLLLVACGDEAPNANNGEAASQSTAAVTPQQVNAAGVVAQVGDQTITFNELNTMLNSSAMVGLSIPALGTPKRNQVIITLLDKVISANLLYLDAKEKGADRLTAYTSGINQFEDAVLVSMYKSKVLIGDIPVTEQEVLDFYKSRISPETELTDDVKLAIESKIRKQRLTERKNTMRERLREGTEIKIFEDVLNSFADIKRSDNDVVAMVADEAITWRDVEVPMRAADHRSSVAEFYIDNDEERLTRLQDYVDNLLMVDKAKASGMDSSPEFNRRTAEYRKTYLINVHRNSLVKSWQPSDDELKTYYVDHMDQIAVPERRKVQMVVVKTKEEAQKIKDDIDSGKITMFKAAQDFSLDPNAKRTLGEMGWVNQGSGFEGLDEFTFNLEPDVVGDPVESPAGWHLVKVTDVIDAQLQNPDDAQTRNTTLRLYMKDKFNDYVVGLRKNRFNVAVYDDELTRQFQKEADYIAELNLKSQQPDSVTKQRVEELQKWIAPAAVPEQ